MPDTRLSTVGWPSGADCAALVARMRWAAVMPGLVSSAGMGNRALLKRLTQVAHARAEGRWTGPGGFGSEARYLAWLARLYHLHQTLGLPAAMALGDGADILQERVRLAALRADLGADAGPGSVAGAGSADRAWGVRYALNGSALGAAVLLKSGAVGPPWASGYLDAARGYVRSGGLARFFRLLDRADLDHARAAAGAAAVFAAMAADA